MNKQVVDKLNMDFVTGALRHMEQKQARFAVALAITEQQEVIVLNDTKLTPKDIHQLLTEAARSIENKNPGGRIQLLN